MNLAELNKVAEAMVAPGRGILAADESSGTIKKRFDAIGVESTADNRRDYRELLFRSSEAMSKYISGVILYDETIRQTAKDGTPPGANGNGFVPLSTLMPGIAPAFSITLTSGVPSLAVWRMVSS